MSNAVIPFKASVMGPVSYVEMLQLRKAVSNGLSMLRPPVRVGRENKIHSKGDISQTKILGNKYTVTKLSNDLKKEPLLGVNFVNRSIDTVLIS